MFDGTMPRDHDRSVRRSNQNYVDAWMQRLVDKVTELEVDQDRERRRLRYELVRLAIVAALAFTLGYVWR